MNELDALARSLATILKDRKETIAVAESSAGGPSGLVIVSSILLAAGLLVLLLRSIGRRAAAG